MPKLKVVQPPNFIAVDGYNATLKCLFDGIYTPWSPIRMWLLLPGSQQPEYLNDRPYSDGKCWVESKPACRNGTELNDCCRFEFIMHSTPHLDDSGTTFYCDNNYTDDSAAHMCK